MIKINEQNYDFYKQIFKIICKFKAKYTPIDLNVEFSPINVLSNWEKQSTAIARRGLQEGLRDALSTIKYLPIELIADLNSNLVSKNFPSLNILTAQIKNLPEKVLDRNKIRNLNEYYIIKEILDDVEYELAKTDRIRLNSIFEEFENEYQEKNPSNT